MKHRCFFCIGKGRFLYCNRFLPVPRRQLNDKLPHGGNPVMFGDQPFTGHQGRGCLAGCGRFLRLFRFGFRFFRFLHRRDQGIQLPVDRGAVKGFLIDDLSADDAVLSKLLPDIDGINVLKPILFLVREKPILLEKPGDPSLHSGPGNVPGSALHCDGKRGQIIPVFLSQPFCRAAFLAMLPHIPSNGPLAVHAAVPFLERGVYIRLGQVAPDSRNHRGRLIRLGWDSILRQIRLRRGLFFGNLLLRG